MRRNDAGGFAKRNAATAKLQSNKEGESAPPTKGIEKAANIRSYVNIQGNALGPSDLMMEKYERAHSEPKINVDRLHVFFGDNIDQNKKKKMFAGYYNQMNEYDNLQKNKDEVGQSNRPQSFSVAYHSMFSSGKSYASDFDPNKAELAFQFAYDIQKHQKGNTLQMPKLMEAIVSSLNNAGFNNPPKYLKDPNVLVLAGEIQNMNDIHEFCDDYGTFMDLIEADIPSEKAALSLPAFKVSQKNVDDHMACSGCSKSFNLGEEAKSMKSNCGHNFHNRCIAAPMRLGHSCPSCHDLKTSDVLVKNFQTGTLRKEQGNYSKFNNTTKKCFHPKAN